MIRTRYLAAAIAAALLLTPVAGAVAWAADDPTPSPTDTSTPTPSETTTPTSTPTPTPTPTQTTPPEPTQATLAARNIRWTKVSATSAKLTWDDPSDKKTGETVHFYVKTTATVGGTTVGTFTKADTTDNSITYDNLLPGSVLRPEVTTVYRHDAGKHDYGSTYTVAQVLPGPVTQLVVQAVAHNKARTNPDVSVSFVAPDTTNGSGTLIDKYEIRLYTADGKLVKKKTVNTAYYTFEKVAYKTEYYVQVRAHNSAGYGKTVKSKTVLTAEKVLYPEFLIPLPKLPSSAPAPKPTQTATPTPTPSATATPASGGGKITVSTGFQPTWFVTSVGVAVIFGAIATFFTVLYYRRRPWRG